MTQKIDEKREPTLEQAVERLETIVVQLESGEANLEKSIDLYLEGRKLGSRALQKLDALERRIQMVVGESEEGLALDNFEENES